MLYQPTDVEGLFSVGGRICSPARSSLARDTVNCLASSMNIWLKEEFGYMCRTPSERTAKVNKFASLSEELVKEAADEKINRKLNINEPEQPEE